MRCENMKVLLTTDVRNLGWLGDVVRVTEGYARNYLLPQGLAVMPTEANIKAFAEAGARASAERELAEEQLARAAASVDGAEAVIAAKANEQGHLFGSVGAVDIAANLRGQGFQVPDDVVDSTQHIKQVGTHQVTLKFSRELTAKVNVVVVAAGKETESDNPEAKRTEPADKETEQRGG